MRSFLFDKKIINIEEKLISDIKCKEVLLKEFEHTNKLLEDNYKFFYSISLLLYSAVGIFIWRLTEQDVKSLFLIYIILALLIIPYFYEREIRKNIILRKELILNKLNNL
ncbi:hypothetical protein B0F89_105122 [Malaciobacter marinus]|jgi:hypothetical protein|uniref:Uncharacterized protein n=1 Tax=Malaciobacter marinus TaxID=505249 RepID=A0AB36ZZ08_9BACT|nr:hypothetical protein [Malaciobacter marinus]PPK62189.1 hypothetical protein B0F89_105122 [Malaciobacter marinus]